MPTSDDVGAALDKLLGYVDVRALVAGYKAACAAGDWVFARALQERIEAVNRRLPHSYMNDGSGGCGRLDAWVGGGPAEPCGLPERMLVHGFPDEQTRPRQLGAIELTFTPITGRVNVSCAVHPWWGRDQIEPNWAALGQAVAVHAVDEHGAEHRP